MAVDAELRNDTWLECVTYSCPPVRRKSLHDFVGSTGVAVVASGESVVVANLGDSRAIFIKQDEVKFATNDHTVASKEERARVLKAKGTIRKGMIVTTEFRQNGWGQKHLAMTRAFGDFGFKSKRRLSSKGPVLLSEPEVSSIESLDTYDFFVVASDGLWSVMSNDDVAEFVKQGLSGPDCNVASCCRDLFKECLHVRKTKDNLTIIIVKISKPQ